MLEVGAGPAGVSRRSRQPPPSPPRTTMQLPDLKPWFDNVSDDYHELPTDDHDAAYDE